MDQILKRDAERQGLTAHCVVKDHHIFEGNRERLWYFSDEDNCLQSPEYGLTDELAVDWLAANLLAQRP